MQLTKVTGVHHLCKHNAIKCLLKDILYFRSKSHYGNLFEKAKYEKEFLKKKRQKAMEVQHANQQEAFLLVMFGLVGLFIFLVARGPSDFDTDRTPYQHNQTDANTEQ